MSIYSGSTLIGTGIALTGTVLTGTMLSWTVLNKTMLSGAVLSGTALNWTALNGTMSNGTWINEWNTFHLWTVSLKKKTAASWKHWHKIPANISAAVLLMRNLHLSYIICQWIETFFPPFIVFTERVRRPLLGRLDLRVLTKQWLKKPLKKACILGRQPLECAIRCSTACQCCWAHNCLLHLLSPVGLIPVGVRLMLSQVIPSDLSTWWCCSFFFSFAVFNRPWRQNTTLFSLEELAFGNSPSVIPVMKYFFSLTKHTKYWNAEFCATVIC